MFYAIISTTIILLMPVLFWPGYRPLYDGIVLAVRIIFKLALPVVGIEIEVRGAENLPQDQAYIMTGKHESTLDAFLMATQAQYFTALAKREVFLIPLLNLVLWKMRMIPIIRDRGTAHRELPDLERIVIRDKRPLLIYPEGTRVGEGDSRPLKQGAFFIQQDTGLPVVTSASNAGKFWPSNSFVMRPGKVVLEIHPPIEPGLEKEAFMNLLHERIIGRSAALRREGEPGSSEFPEQ